MSRHEGALSGRSIKKVLFSVLIVGVTAATAGSGVAASFNAQTTNAGNTFATGTLTLSDTANGTVCLSTSGVANVNSNCNAVVDGSLLHVPGDAVTASFVIENTGTLTTPNLSIFTSACVDADTSTTSAYHGAGSPCSTLNFYLQEWTGGLPGAGGAASACWLGGGTAATCDATFTLAQPLTALTAHSSLATKLPLIGAFTSGKRYFTMGFQLPVSAGNALQGRAASVDFTWHLDQ
jgi:hypothetical protein